MGQWCDGAAGEENRAGIGVYLLPAEPGGMLQHQDVLLEEDFGDTISILLLEELVLAGGRAWSILVCRELEPHGFRDNTCHISVSLLPVDSSWWQQGTRAEILKIILGCHSGQFQCWEFLPWPLGRALAEPTALCLCGEGSGDSRTPHRERGAGN